MNKRILMIIGTPAAAVLFLIVSNQATNIQASPTSNTGTMALPGHLANLSQEAKFKLFRSASNYLGSLNQYKTAVEAYLNMDIEKYKKSCRDLAMLQHNCPPLEGPDYDVHANRTNQAAAELARAKVIFECEIRRVALQACKEVGQFCNVQNKGSIQKIFSNLPPTQYDTVIVDALDKLPRTREIFSDISGKLVSDSRLKKDE